MSFITDINKKIVSNIGKAVSSVIPSSAKRQFATLKKDPLSLGVPKNVNTIQLPTSAISKGAFSVGKSIVSTVSKAVSQAKPSTKIKLALATPLVAGVVVGAPKETFTAIVNYPKTTFKVGKDITVLAKDPTLSGLKSFISEHPFATTGAIASLGFATGSLVYKTAQVAGVLQDDVSDKVKDFIAKNSAVSSGKASIPMGDVIDVEDTSPKKNKEASLENIGTDKESVTSATTDNLNVMEKSNRTATKRRKTAKKSKDLNINMNIKDYGRCHRKY